MIEYGQYKIGDLEVFLACQGDALIAIDVIEALPAFLTTYPDAKPGGGKPLLQAAVGQLIQYIEGRRQQFNVKLAPKGTEFQRQVWRALQEIPYGQTTHYQAIGEQIGRPQAARAVGAAVGRNPLLIMIPCHRVIGKNGHLTGYRAGLNLKAALLSLEAASPEAAPHD